MKLMIAPNGRLYAPEIGRFLQRDPASGLGGNHLYAHACPTVYVDPDGFAESATPEAPPEFPDAKSGDIIPPPQASKLKREGKEVSVRNVNPPGLPANMQHVSEGYAQKWDKWDIDNQTYHYRASAPTQAAKDQLTAQALAAATAQRASGCSLRPLSPQAYGEYWGKWEESVRMARYPKAAVPAQARELAVRDASYWAAITRWGVDPCDCLESFSLQVGVSKAGWGHTKLMEGQQAGYSMEGAKYVQATAMMKQVGDRLDPCCAMMFDEKRADHIKAEVRWTWTLPNKKSEFLPGDIWWVGGQGGIVSRQVVQNYHRVQLAAYANLGNPGVGKSISFRAEFAVAGHPCTTRRLLLLGY